jgi:hypothetical protein
MNGGVFLRGNRDVVIAVRRLNQVEFTRFVVV